MQEEQEEMIKTGKPEKRRPSGFKNGVIIGLVLGLLITGIGAGVGIRAYANLTNNYVIFGPQGVKQTAKDNVLDQAAIKKVDELLSYIDLYYNDSYKEKDIRNAIYKGTLSGLGDPYSVYYTVDEYKDLQTSTNGNYYGIGAALSQNAKTMEVTVVKVYEGTPAEEAGLKNGDEILSVDKYEATSMELSNLVKKIRGKEGTKVHLKVYRSQTGENLELDVERKNVDIPSVDSKMLSDGIGYIQISEFQSNTAKQFKKAFVALEKEDMKGLDDLIVGLLLTVVSVVVILKFRNVALNIGLFIVLLLGSYGMIRGILEILYSLKLQRRKSNNVKIEIMKIVVAVTEFI